MVNSLGISQQRFVRKLLLLPIVSLLVAILLLVNFAFAKKLELNEKQVEKIKIGLDLAKTFGNIVLSEDKLKMVFNTVFTGGETSVDITYGLLVLSAFNEMELIDLVISQRYKQIATDYFNSILDEKSNLFHYYKGIGFDLPKVLSGKITGPISALTLNTFSMTNEIIQIFAAFENLRTEKLYDGLWRYFDDRRHNSSHNEAWEFARYQMGWAVNSSSYLPQKLKSGDDGPLQIQFAQLWDKWGQHTTAFGVTAEAKRQFNEEMRGLVAQAIEDNTFAEKVSFPSPLGNIQSAIANLAESVKRLSMEAVGAIADKAYALTKNIISTIERIISRGGASLISIGKLNSIKEIASDSESILTLVKDEENKTKPGLVENEANPVENLASLSLPQIQKKVAEVQLQLVSSKEGKILNLIKDAVESLPSSTLISIPTPAPTPTPPFASASSPLSQPIVTYPKILISEVQTAGATSHTEEFVELYNPTNGQVDLTDWYIQKKTQGADSFSTFASKNILSGKTIQAKGYFLVAREGSSFATSADAVTSYSLGDNTTLAVKNPNGEIVDKIGWGDVQDAENVPALNPQASQSLNRIWDTVSQTYYDRDNNAIDFASRNLASPKTKNIEDAPRSSSSPQDTTPPAIPGAPVATSPATDRTPTWTWSASTDEESGLASPPYIIEWSAVSSFQSGVSSAGATVNSFTHSIELADGTWYARVKAKDAANNESQYSSIGSTTIDTLDKTIPVVSYNALASTQTNTSFTISWTATDPVGDVSPSGIQYIYVEYSVTPSATGVFARYNNNGVWTNWQAGSVGKITLNAQTTSLSLRAQDGVSYTFQVSASDVAGNASTTSSASTAVTLPKTVVINEIAWMGTTVSATDEWVELYNTTNSPVSLVGWTLAADDGTPSIQLAGTIGALSYFLLERTADTTVSNVSADQIYTGALADEGEYLRLSNASSILVDAVDASASWFSGDSTTKQSMERVSASQGGSKSSNWAKNNIIQHNGKDAGIAIVYGTPGNWINGTPKQANSTVTSPTTIDDSDLRFDEFNTITLTLLGSPYITTAGIVSIIVPAGKTLIVEPGVIVKFKDSAGYLTVQGTLKAQGTQENQITFTVDTGTVWCGIRVISPSTASQLDYVTIDKAQSLTGGGGCNQSFITYSMYVESSAVTMNNSVIQLGAGYRKLYLKNSNSTINASTISGAALNADSVGIYVDGGSPTISNSTISNNSIGIFVNSLSNTPTIQNNTFTGNTYALKLDSASPALSGNTATNNTYNGIYFEGAILSNTTWQAHAIPYILNSFTVSAGATLTMQAGVVVKFINLGNTNPELVVNGALVTQGTAASPVVFTTTSDNTVGGSNTYGGVGSIPSWKRIYIAPGSTGSQLTYATLKSGGNTYYQATLYVKQSSVQLSNVTISNSAQSAIYSSLGTVSGSGVTLSNNTYGFHIELGDCPTLSGTNVTANVGPTLHPSSFPVPPCSF